MAKRENEVYSKNIHFHFYDCDFKKTVKLSAILRHLADLAGEDYTELGFDHSYLWERGMVFLLSRFAVRIHRNINYDETVEFATYERGTKGALFYRDYYVKDKSGAIIISARSTWIMCDPISRKILRPASFEKKISDHWDWQLDCPETARLKLPETAALVGTRRIAYSDLDANGHVYNAVYGDIACDFLPHELMEREIADFSINFQQEAKLGDELTIYTQVDGLHANVGGRIGETSCFDCEFLFKE